MDPHYLYPLLFLTAFVAGFIDSIAGGGGLITVPVLLSAGMTPQDTFGTNKLQATFGSGGATWHFSKAGMIDWRECFWGVIWTAVGAAVGTFEVQQVDPTAMRKAIPFLLLTILLYTVFKPQLGAADVHPRTTPRRFYLLAGLGIGFYDGFFGPGTGSFWAMAFMLGLGFNLTKATAHTKAMNFTSNVVSLAVFLAGRHVHLGAGLLMGAGQWLGATLGSKMVLRKGTSIVRPLFITMVLIMTAKLIYDNYFHH
jgi:uncharacterized membrane protein YfcA